MAKCDFCGKDVLYPYKCKYCGGLFCEDHRLPPNHKCPNINLWKDKEPPSISRIPTRRERETKPKPRYIPHDVYVRRKVRKKRKVSKKAVALLIFLVLGGLIYYAYASGYYNFTEQASAISSFFSIPSIGQSSPKETHLKIYPVKVWYDVAPKELKYWWGGKENVKAVQVYFKNEGSERVSFLIDPTGTYVIDESGDNKYVGYVGTTNEIVLHPNELKSAEIYFYNLPDKGWLYVRIDYVDITNVYVGKKITYKELGEYKGSETIKLYFEAS